MLPYPFHTFAMFLSLVLAGLLVGQAAPAPVQATAADTNLLAAAKLGDLARARDLLSAGASVNATDRRGFTPLMWACANGSVPVVTLLIENRASVDARAGDGTTALLLAAANGFTDIVRALLERGADVSAASGGLTAREYALARGHTDIAELLGSAETLGSRLLQAATEGHDMVVRQLLSAGAPVNVTDAQGATALMIAARNGDLGILQALLTKGADASVRDAHGRTVFEWAAPSPSTATYVEAFLRDRGITNEAARASVTPQAPQVKASLAALADLMARVPPVRDDVRRDRQRANAGLSQLPALSANWQRANTALSQLLALSAKWPANSPDDYRDNLAGHVSALDDAVKAGDAARLAATLQSVADDLEIKLDHCTRSGGTLGGSVVVRVRTLQGSEERKSWQVFYIPKVFEAAANTSPDLFPRLSSPTDTALVPGRYVMWVRDPVTARTGERTLVRVGGGVKELLLDLPVPAVPAR